MSDSKRKKHAACMVWKNMQFLFSFGMEVSGFTSQVLLSLEASGFTFKMQISTILSLATLIPVVSKSKTHNGLWSFKFIRFFPADFANSEDYKNLQISVISVRFI